MPEDFDFDEVGVRPEPKRRVDLRGPRHRETRPDNRKNRPPRAQPTKTPECAHIPGEPEKCEFFGCERRQNLWAYEFDTKVIWLCWPHFRRYRNQSRPYTGRMSHHEFALKYVTRDDYPFQERQKHHDFAKRALNQLVSG